jgi:CTP:molybdopterin cytidylyltransferase MocA
MTSFSIPTQASKLRLAVLLLAAGEGSRLGSHPKALLYRDGQTLLHRFSSAIQRFKLVEYIVVTGFHAQAVESEITKLNSLLASPIEIIRNNSPEQGQASSVRLGLESLRSEFDVLLVALSDQPEIGVQEVQELLDAFINREGGQAIILPMVNGKRGNPVLFSRQAVCDVLATSGMICRSYMDAYPEKVGVMSTSNQAFVLDVDTLEDIQNLKLSLT